MQNKPQKKEEIQSVLIEFFEIYVFLLRPGI